MCPWCWSPLNCGSSIAQDFGQVQHFCAIENKKSQQTFRLLRYGRSMEIWTPGLLVPNQARYHLRYTPKENGSWLAAVRGCGRRIRTLTIRVRVAGATITQFRIVSPLMCLSFRALYYYIKQSRKSQHLFGKNFKKNILSLRSHLHFMFVSIMIW